jgi:rubredoxin
LSSYVCDVCGYIYDPTEGDLESKVKPGTPWEDLPAGWICPVCGAPKESFTRMDD